MTRVKICGIQDLADAVAAAKAGADFVGFVFVPGRRRRLPEEKAQDMIRALRQRVAGNKPRVVGLFADQPIEEVNRIAQRCGLDLVQLCGQESLDYCARVERPILKVLHVRDTLAREEAIDSLAQRIQELEKQGHTAILDRYEEGLQGGTGRAFDWSIAQELARRGLRFLLAGGLTPQNVAHAVEEVRPWGVDVSSGVETRGVKDHGKIRAFIAAVRGVSPFDG